MTAQEICSESSQVEMSEHDSSQVEMSEHDSSRTEMTPQEICSESSQVEMSEHDSSQPEMSESGFISDLSTPLYSAWMEASSARSGTQSDARHARMLARARHTDAGQ